MPKPALLAAEARLSCLCRHVGFEEPDVYVGNLRSMRETLLLSGIKRTGIGTLMQHASLPRTDLPSTIIRRGRSRRTYSELACAIKDYLDRRGTP